MSEGSMAISAQQCLNLARSQLLAPLQGHRQVCQVLLVALYQNGMLTGRNVHKGAALQ